MAGDAALLVEFEERIDPRVNAASRLRWRDAVRAARDRLACATWCRPIASVGVSFDPLRTDLGRLLDAHRALAAAPARRGSRRPRAGARSGLLRRRARSRPRRVAAVAGMTVEADDRASLRAASTACSCSASCPGFAYLGLVDERIAAPRRADAARPRAGRVGRHRRTSDRHLSGRNARRLAADRPHAAAAVRSRARDPLPVQAGRRRPVLSDRSSIRAKHACERRLSDE